MSTELATRPADIKSTLQGDKFKLEVARTLPTHLKPERFIRIALTAMNRTPKLLNCTPASFFKCLLDLSALGLEPDGRRAHLIPYGTECTLIIDWKGLAELAMRSGIVSTLHADVVCENDTFEYDRGELKTHKVNYKEPRGKVFAAYALCKFKDGNEKCDVMSIDEIVAIKKRSRSGNNGPWVTDFNEMAKKTVFRRLSKWLPLSAEFRDAIEKDEVLLDEPRDERPAIGRLVPNDAEPFTLPAEEEPQATPEPEPIAEDRSASLLSSLLAKAAAAKPKLSEKDLTSTLIAMRLIEPSEKLADLDEKRIANIVDAWDEGAVAEWIKENAK